MDKAYDAPQIWNYKPRPGTSADHRQKSRRGGKEEAEAETRARRLVGHPTAEDIRFKERSAAERFKLQPERQLRRSLRPRARPAKVMCHLMFGSLPDHRAVDAPRHIATGRLETWIERSPRRRRDPRARHTDKAPVPGENPTILPQKHAVRGQSGAERAWLRNSFARRL